MTTQEAFIAAVIDPARPVPAGLIGPGGAAAGKRFDVYRNNVAVSLTDALEAGFPVVAKLVGAKFFKAMAGVYLRAHPPSSPVLSLYGEDFAAFIAGFPPASALPYLPDVARLEYALRRAYHAADPGVFDAEALTALPTDRLMQARFVFAEAVQMLVSPFPVHSIWRSNTETSASPIGTGGETVLITRPQFDPVQTVIPERDASFLSALLGGAPLAEALEAAPAPDFDLSTVLGLLLAQGAITAVTERL